MTYLHRNGETEQPTEPGWYWLKGKTLIYDMWWGKYESLVYVGHYGPHLRIEMRSLDDFRGQWWGPLLPPWEQEAAE